jgi:hypothetical protein
MKPNVLEYLEQLKALNKKDRYYCFRLVLAELLEYEPCQLKLSLLLNVPRVTLDRWIKESNIIRKWVKS